MAGCGAELEANSLITDLTQDAQFPIPDVDLSGITFPDDVLDHKIDPLTIQQVTTTLIDGNGSFDTLMRGFKSHLQKEWEDGRITGDDYTKAYISLTEAAMNQGLAFVMGKDGAFWQAQLVQVQAFTARVELEIAKARLAATQYDAANQKATYALTKMRLATSSVEYCTAQYNLANILPKQGLQLDAQTGMTNEQKKLVTEEIAGQKVATDTASYNLAQMLPAQLGMVGAQKLNVESDTSINTYRLANLLPAEKSMMAVQETGQKIANDTATYNLANIQPAQLQTILQQRLMLNEQTEAQRAQTTDTRTDGIPVTGVLGKQKDLYTQQITSYQRDSELKVARVFSDAWITQKTIDEGLLPPNSFTNVEIEKVLVDVRTKANVGV